MIKVDRKTTSGKMVKRWRREAGRGRRQGSSAKDERPHFLDVVKIKPPFTAIVFV